MLDTRPLGSASPSAVATATERARTALGKDDFLRLLVTQLRHQDPLNPLDQNEFLSQSAQFTSLEELQNIRQALEAIQTASTESSLRDGAVLLGRRVSAAGRAVDFAGSPVRLTFTTRAPVSHVDVEILDASGRVVRQLAGGPAGAGSQVVEWDGRDGTGQPAAAGRYVYRVSAPGSEANPAQRPVAASGFLTAIERQGTTTLFRVGDALIRQEDIIEIA